VIYGHDLDRALPRQGFGNRLTVRVQVDPDVLQTVVPVLSLQPLV